MERNQQHNQNSVNHPTITSQTTTLLPNTRLINDQNNYLSFLDELTIDNNNSQQHKTTTIRSNECFTVYSQHQHTQSSQSQSSQLQSLTISLQNLTNPQLTILQTYQLLNPYDKIFTVVVQQKQQQQIEQQKQHSSNKPLSQKIKLFIQKLKQSSSSKRTSFQNNDISNINQAKYYKCSFSLFFLYYIKKLYNQLWQRLTVSLQSFLSLSSSQQLILQEFQLRLVYAFYKMYGQIYTQQQSKIQAVIYKLFQLLQLDNYLPVTIQKQNRHKGIEHFLLYKLYKSNGIQSEWSIKYQHKLKSISYNEFKVLYQLQNMLDSSIMPIKQIQSSIINDENLQLYFQQQQQQQYENNLQPNTINQSNKIHFNIQQQDNNNNNNLLLLSTKDRSKPSRMQQFTNSLITVLIQNLYNYQLVENYTYKNNCMLGLFGLRVKKGQQNYQQRQNDNNIGENNILQQLYQQYLPNNPQHHTTRQFTANKQTFNYQPHSHSNPIFLSQLHHHNLLFSNSSQEMFTKLVPVITVDLFMNFKLFKMHNSENYDQQYLQDKRWFVQLSMDTLVWKDGIKALEVDKLYLWGLLFGVENRPIVIKSPVDKIEEYIKYFNPSTRNIITKTIRNLIRNELQPITILGHQNIQAHLNNQHSPNYIFIFPFIHLLILAYEIFQPKSLSLFLEQTTQKYQQQTLQQNLMQLVKDLHLQYVQCINRSDDNDKSYQTQIQSISKLSHYSGQLIFTLVKYHKNLLNAGIQIK